MALGNYTIRAGDYLVTYNALGGEIGRSYSPLSPAAPLAISAAAAPAAFPVAPATVQPASVNYYQTVYELAEEPTVPAQSRALNIVVSPSRFLAPDAMAGFDIAGEGNLPSASDARITGTYAGTGEHLQSEIDRANLAGVTLPAAFNFSDPRWVWLAIVVLALIVLGRDSK